MSVAAHAAVHMSRTLSASVLMTPEERKNAERYNARDSRRTGRRRRRGGRHRWRARGVLSALPRYLFFVRYLVLSTTATRGRCRLPADRRPSAIALAVQTFPAQPTRAPPRRQSSVPRYGWALAMPESIGRMDRASMSASSESAGLSDVHGLRRTTHAPSCPRARQHRRASPSSSSVHPIASRWSIG